MKILKSRIFIFLLGLIIAGSIGVYATIKVQSNEIGYKNGTVQDALDDLYTKTSNKFCELKTGTALTIGSKYECDPGDTTKRNFYVLAVDTNKVKLIMEHNITEGSSTTTMTWKDAMKYIDANNLKTSWSNVLDVDLPMVQDIADAVGNTGWNMEDKNYDGWFYLDPNNGTYGQTKVANASNLSNYRWLYNYTRECTNFGCDPETSLGTTEAYGYWTRDVVPIQKDTNGRAWLVATDGYLYTNHITSNATVGVRPVITVLRSNLYE